MQPKRCSPLLIYRFRDMEERATTSKDTGTLPIMYSDFSAPSDCDQGKFWHIFEEIEFVNL